MIYISAKANPFVGCTSLLESLGVLAVSEALQHKDLSMHLLSVPQEQLRS